MLKIHLWHRKYKVRSETMKEEEFQEPSPHTHGKPLNWLAPIYDWVCQRMGMGRAFRQTTLQYAGVKPGERVLDVGCGTGVLTRLAAEAVGSVAIGIDPAQKMIAIARKNASLLGSRAKFRIAVIEDLPFEDNTFDCVLSSLMIHHLPLDLKLRGLVEIYRVLKPGGRLLVVDINRPANPLWWVLCWPLYFWSFTKDHMRGRLETCFIQTGFNSIERLGRWKGILSFWMMFK